MSNPEYRKTADWNTNGKGCSGSLWKGSENSQMPQLATPKYGNQK